MTGALKNAGLKNAGLEINGPMRRGRKYTSLLFQSPHMTDMDT